MKLYSLDERNYSESKEPSKYRAITERQLTAHLSFKDLKPQFSGRAVNQLVSARQVQSMPSTPLTPPATSEFVLGKGGTFCLPSTAHVPQKQIQGSSGRHPDTIIHTFLRNCVSPPPSPLPNINTLPLALLNTLTGSIFQKGPKHGYRRHYCHLRISN